MKTGAALTKETIGGVRTKLKNKEGKTTSHLKINAEKKAS